MAAITAVLALSVTGGAVASPALAGPWEAEIQRRLAEYDRGEVQAIDAEEVFAKARRLQ